MRRVENNKDNRRFENKMLGGKEKKSSIYIEEGDGAFFFIFGQSNNIPGRDSWGRGQCIATPSDFPLS